ncbi:MAG: hypothetical protein NVS1B14_08630 [Vulcanimicrobiaceae bacterium]
MKARRIALDGLLTPQSARQRILSVRFAEVLQHAPAFSHGRARALHALRIACKRLRYAVDLFEDDLPAMRPPAQRLRQLQDELGSVHDCDVLIETATRCDATPLLRRLHRDRARHAVRARALWADGFSPGGPFGELVAFTGFGTMPA